MGSTPIYSIPFADPSDLVRDWPALSEDVAEAVESAISGLPVPDPPAGIGSNVVQTLMVTPFSSTSNSFVDVTGYTATITPSSVTSKVLVLVNITLAMSSTSSFVEFRMLRGSTTIGGIGQEGDLMFRELGTPINNAKGFSLAILDSPASNTATTYKGELRVPNGTGRVADRVNGGTPFSTSLTLIEVAV